MRFCHIVKLPDTKNTTIISLIIEIMQTFNRSEGIKTLLISIWLKNMPKKVNSKVTKILSALWETLAQSASRVRGCLFVWGFLLVFFLFFCILWPFLLAKGVSCLMVGIHPLARLLKTASVLPQKITFDKTQITKCLSSPSNLKDDWSCWGW